MRKLVQRENELRIEILESLSRSQRALAVIIENMAEVTGAGKEPSEGMLEGIQSLGKFQRILAERILGIKLRHVASSGPGPWWLSRKVRRGTNSR